MFAGHDEFTVFAACFWGVSIFLSLVFVLLWAEVGGRIRWTSRIFSGMGLACLGAAYLVAVVKLVFSVPGVHVLYCCLPVAAIGFLIRVYVKNCWQS